ncbi:hypothetical protein RUM43_001710 [Polyplax serrata]|uniref:Uncharacterized protein n=1 Tax=Polyplax serrata TaxID=468196 RepID=A0AAN8SEA4_POLSC
MQHQWKSYCKSKEDPNHPKNLALALRALLHHPPNERRNPFSVVLGSNVGTKLMQHKSAIERRTLSKISFSTRMLKKRYPKETMAFVKYLKHAKLSARLDAALT